MLSSNLQTILDNRLRYLPDISSKAITSIDWSTKVIEIGHKYGLHIEDIEDMQMVVLKSMTGLASPEDFETNLITATAASPSTVEKIINDLNATVFEPIHQFVMRDGKEPDPLTAQGIVLQPDQEDIPEPASSIPENLETLDIPTSPESVTPKPQVGSFEGFFVNTPTRTDHSMIK